MPFYSFQLEGSNVVIERWFHMREAPSIGTEIMVDDRLCRRLPSDWMPSGLDCDRKFDKYPYASHALPREGHMPPHVRGMTRFDRTGKPIIRSKKHEADIAAHLDMQKM